MADTSFNFWKDNRMDQHFLLSPKELSARFHDWIYTKENQPEEWDRLTYYSNDIIVRMYIAEKGGHGLASNYDEAEFKEIYKLLKPIIAEKITPNRKGNPLH